MKKLLILLVVVFIFSCSDNKMGHETNQVSSSDGDTLIEVAEEDEEESEEGMTFEDICFQYESSVSDTISKNDSVCDISFAMKYYSSKDSSINVLTKYISWDVKEDYITNSNVLEIIMKKDTNKVHYFVKSADFDELVEDESIRNHGVLLYPNFQKDTLLCGIRINMSYSIPLSDIGVPVQVLVNMEGLKFSSGY